MSTVNMLPSTKKRTSQHLSWLCSLNLALTRSSKAPREYKSKRQMGGGLLRSSLFSLMPMNFGKKEQAMFALPTRAVLLFTVAAVILFTSSPALPQLAAPINRRFMGGGFSIPSCLQHPGSSSIAHQLLGVPGVIHTPSPGQQRSHQGCMPDLPGYATWAWPGSDGAEAAGGGEARNPCELFWGNGYSDPVSVFGDPPEGTFQDAERRVAGEVCAEAEEQERGHGEMLLGTGNRGMVLGMSGEPETEEGRHEEPGTHHPYRSTMKSSIREASSRGSDNDSSGSSSSNVSRSAGNGAGCTGNCNSRSARRGSKLEQTLGKPSGVSSQDIEPRMFPESSQNGWLRCFHNPTLGSSICEGSMVAVYPGRIKMSQGGEELEEVAPFRGEEEELPTFLEGAVEVALGRTEFEWRRGLWRLEQRMAEEQASESGGGERRESIKSRSYGDGQSLSQKKATQKDDIKLGHVQPESELGRRVTTTEMHVPSGTVLVEGQGRDSEADTEGTTESRPGSDPEAGRHSHSLLEQLQDVMNESDATDQRSIPVPSDLFRLLMPTAFPKEHQELWGSVRAVESVECSEVVDHPTLFMIRFDYANLYHAATTWMSAYQATKLAGLKLKPQIVLLDGHAKSGLDSVLSTLFAGHRFTKSFATDKDKGVCFRHAIFLPPGFHSPIFKDFTQSVADRCLPIPGTPGSAAAERVTEFAEFVAQSFGTKSEQEHWSPRLEKSMGRKSDKHTGLETAQQHDAAGAPSSPQQEERKRRLEQAEAKTGPSVVAQFSRGAPQDTRKERPVRVLFVRRDPLWVHPRQAMPIKANPRLQDQEGLVAALQKWAQEYAGYAKIKWGDMSHTVMQRGRPIIGDKIVKRKRRIYKMERMLLQEPAIELSGVKAVDKTKRQIAAIKGVPHQEAEAGQTIMFVNGTVAQWSFEQQLKYVQWADVLVGAHGAGLTHALFMRPGCAVVELRPENDGRAAMERLAKLRGLNYSRISSDTLPEQLENVKKVILAFMTRPLEL